VLALGPSAYPKNDRDLTVRTMYPQYNNSIKKEKKGKQYLFAKLIKKSCWLALKKTETKNLIPVIVMLILTVPYTNNTLFHSLNSYSNLGF
jgi:hypothetical protein